MLTDTLQELVNKITNKTNYLSVKESSLPYYISSFLSMSSSKKESENIIEYVSYIIDVDRLPSLYKKPLMELIRRFEFSPLSFYSFNFSIKTGFFYNCTPGKQNNEYAMLQWIRCRGYKNIDALELKWSFLTEESRTSEYLKLYKYAQKEVIKELKKMKPLVNQFNKDTSRLLSELYAVEMNRVF
ncbi:hypothetical protein O0Q50_19140 [Priestia aryabhattai]|uniref:Uncharacterized protein n=1 Tax=Priestia aryabhattai TaxID=412384 RepID=A0AAX6NBW3_PRIAR|nr:hypothetical protein [Priestia aryabhattai]MDU9693289.1 hypothetical protein [Priestia aryabhattai]